MAASPTCTWKLADEQSNNTKLELTYTFILKADASFSKEDGKHNDQSSDHHINLAVGFDIEFIKDIVAKPGAVYKYSREDKAGESQAERHDKANSSEKNIKVTLPPDKSLFLWQATAKIGDRSVRLPSYKGTETRDPPKTPINLSDYDLKEAQIQIPIFDKEGSSLVRIRHKVKGKYLVGISHFFWETATLGDEQNACFRIIPRTSKRGNLYFKIKIENPRYQGYEFLYSGIFGDVYVGRDMNGCKQQRWRMSIENPVNGDAVTFRNMYWQSSGLVFYDGSGSCVQCLKSNNLDLWVLEVVEPNQ